MSNSFCASRPSFSANRNASATTIIDAPRIMLLQSLAAWPLPGPPACTMVLPMPSSSGRARSKASSAPPTMKVSVAACAPATPPDTGASTMASPFARAAWATSRAVSTSMVEESMSSVPGATAASTPPSLRSTSRTCSPARSMVITASASLHVSAIDCTFVPRPAASRAPASSLTSKPETAWPILIRFSAIGSPILPSPMKPTFAMAFLHPGYRYRVRVTPLFRLLARGHQRKPQIGPEQDHLHRDDPDVAAKDLRKQQLHRRHRDQRGEPHHRAPRRGQPQPDRRDRIDDREEHRRHLIGRRIGIEAGRERRADAADDRPVIEALDQRQAGHHPQEQNQPTRP